MSAKNEGCSKMGRDDDGRDRLMTGVMEHGEMI